MNDALQQSIEDLLQLPHLTPEAVGEALGITLEPTAGTSFFAMYEVKLPAGEARPDGVTSVELRAPLQPKGAQDGLLVIELAGIALTLRDAVARRGHPAQLLPSMPEDPQRTLSAWYPLPGGILKLVFDATAATLCRFVIDRTERR